MRKNKHNFYIQALDRPGTVGPDRPSAHHDPLKGYRAMPGLRLKPSGPVRHARFISIACRASSPKAQAQSSSDRPSLA
jgi:hypothetical protein